MENLTFWNKGVWIWFVACLVGFSGQNAYAFISNYEAGYTESNPPGMDPVLFTFNCMDGQPGDTICIPVTVENFTNILIGQFEIIWDSDVLDYLEIRNEGLTEINPSDFNLSGPNTLKFIPLNFDPFNGETLPDDAVIFEICFRIIGIPGSSSTITIS